VNPPSGTVVDDVVTLPERYDFYLISQSVRVGTVNPTSYNVIWDESGLKPDHIQKLTYKVRELVQVEGLVDVLVLSSPTDVPLVLQLGGDGQGAGAVPVRAQVGVPRRGVPPRRPLAAPGPVAVLSMICHLL
jgi:hypothetical protein